MPPAADWKPLLRVCRWGDVVEPSMLFSGMEERPVEKGRAVEGPFATVAIERSLDRTLDYSVPRGMAASLRVGQRVKVPLGKRNRPVTGYVVSIQDVAGTAKTVKPVLAIDDERVLLSAEMLELARWMSRYYCAPLGVVIDTIIPSAV